MGTTVSILIILNNDYIVTHVGDSRIYHMLNPYEIKQLTEDHSWVQLQVSQGLLTPEEARNHPRKNVLLQCLGIEDEIKPYQLQGECHNHDLFLLCTDGFYSLFTNNEILSLLVHLLEKYNSLQQITDHLIELAITYRATDNITVLLVRANLPARAVKGWKHRIRNIFKR